MISVLTKAQEAALTTYRDKWIAIGLSTTPTDRVKAEAALVRCYELAGLVPPKEFIWCLSPKELLLKASNYKGNSVRNSVWSIVRNSVRNSVRDSIWHSVRNSVKGSVWDSVGNSVGNSVWSSVSNSVWNSVCYGQHDAHWLGFYEYFREELQLKQETEQVTGLIEAAHHIGWWIPYKDICFVSEKPCLLNLDTEGRLHSETEPAILYKDGFCLYAVHGQLIGNRG